MIRFILCISFVVLFLIVTIPVGFIFFIIGLFDQHKKDMASMCLVRQAFRILLFLAGTKLTIIGEEKIPRDEPVLYVANHRSFFDIVSTDSRVFAPTGYIAKKELLKVPLLSWWMKNIRCEFLDRKDVRQGLDVYAPHDRENSAEYLLFRGLRDRAGGGAHGLKGRARFS